MNLNFTHENKVYTNFTVPELLDKGVPELIVLSAVGDCLKSELAAHRWNVESGGTLVNDMDIKTDEFSQAKIANALTTLQRGTVASLDFKSSNGWGTVDLATIEAIADAVALHVQKCYSVERAVSSQIELLTTLKDIEAFDIGSEWETAWANT